MNLDDRTEYYFQIYVRKPLHSFWLNFIHVSLYYTLHEASRMIDSSEWKEKIILNRLWS